MKFLSLQSVQKTNAIFLFFAEIADRMKKEEDDTQYVGKIRRAPKHAQSYEIAVVRITRESYEKNLPTQSNEKKKTSRISCKNENSFRPLGSFSSSSKRP